MFPHRNVRALKKGHKNQAFALVVALGIMSFVLLLVLSISILLEVEWVGARGQLKRLEAEQAALLSLNIAIGKLQETVGLDQRVTATAEILNDTANLYVGKKTPVEGQGSWTGVWKSDTVSNKTPSYDPSKPDEREFVGWLVSSENPSSGEFELPQSLDAIKNKMTDSVTLATDSKGNDYATVGRVGVDSISPNQISYAFMIEDESVKADLSWSEHSTSLTSSERYQAGRLGAAPGPDYGAFDRDSTAASPFSSVTYPLARDRSSLISNQIEKLSSVTGITTNMDSRANADVWLKDLRGDVTWGSRGVIADVKFGGLRRDLSLAFEMDGDADVSVLEQPARFNRQVGEFVGNGDRLSAPKGLKPKGMPTEERFLWRDYKNSGTTFSSDIKDASSVLRGPNWWALRDYANLYKRLSATGGEYVMEARPYYPNKSTETIAYSERFDINKEADTWDRQTNIQFKNGRMPKGTEHYLYRVAAPNYTPVNLGNSIIVSMLATNVKGVTPNQTVDLAVALDPLFYFWNPYNIKIQCEHIAVRLDSGFPGVVKLWVNDKVHSEMGLADLLAENVANSVGSGVAFLIRDSSGGPIILEPGEVVIASPSTAGTGEAFLGYVTNNTSGIIMTKLNGANPVTVNSKDKVEFSFFTGEANGGIRSTRHDMDTSIPHSSATGQTITVDFDSSGEETQSMHLPMWTSAQDMAKYVSGAALNKSNKVTSLLAGSLANGKAYFGAHAVLIKPASSGAEAAGPVEMFSRFNPAPMLMKRDYFADCMPNQIYRHVTANGWNAVLDEVGISFSGSNRGTFWGLSYQYTGSTSVPIASIPSSPLISLAQFANANLSVMGTDPFRAVGNSWSSPLITPTSPYGEVEGLPGSWPATTAQDYSWLINDALFDRYYLSGLAPDFSINSVGYSKKSDLKVTLERFFDDDDDPKTNFIDAQANPVLRPYLPSGEETADRLAALSTDDGFRKLGAYSLIEGVFNVNSTSVPAWRAFLSANRNLIVEYAQSAGRDSSGGTPFPGSLNPVALGSAKPEWAGFSRLTDSQVNGLAERIVEQVKLRGPFMSLSDFVNHRVGGVVPNSDVSYTGALQAALDLEAASGSGINARSRAAAENRAAVDAGAASGSPQYPKRYYDDTLNVNKQKTTTGIPGEITQANLLLPLAPRLSARADTFRVRAYGEVSSTLGNDLSVAVCEAVIQRLPEYVDSSDEPWKDPWKDLWGNPSKATSELSEINQRFGRRFKVVEFRWLDLDEL